MKRTESSENSIVNFFNAVEQGNLKEVINYVETQGIEIGVESKYMPGTTAIDIAAAKGHLEVVIYLTERGANKDSALARAAMNNQLEVGRYLIGAGADVNNIVSDLPLFYAVLNGHKEMVNLLLDNDANVNAIGFRGNKPLAAAILNFNIARSEYKQDYVSITKKLIDNGVDIHGFEADIEAMGLSNYTPDL